MHAEVINLLFLIENFLHTVHPKNKRGIHAIQRQNPRAGMPRTPAAPATR